MNDLIVVICSWWRDFGVEGEGGTRAVCIVCALWHHHSWKQADKGNSAKIEYKGTGAMYHGEHSLSNIAQPDTQEELDFCYRRSHAVVGLFLLVQMEIGLFMVAMTNQMNRGKKIPLDYPKKAAVESSYHHHHKEYRLRFNTLETLLRAIQAILLIWTQSWLVKKAPNSTIKFEQGWNMLKSAPSMQCHHKSGKNTT